MHKIAQKSWSENIFKAYDVRGKYPEEINEDAAYKIARAFARYLKIGNSDGRILKIIVSADARKSSPALKEAFLDGLLDEGAGIIDAGLTTTPMHYFIVNETAADGGAMITASHNPPEFNGIKLSKKGAAPIGGGAGMEEIKNDALRGIFQNAKKRGEIEKKDFSRDYAEFLISRFPHLKTEVGKLISGKKVTGVSFDSDGDRMAFKDEKGNIVSENSIMALLADNYAKPGEKIVYDLTFSRAVKEAIEAKEAVPVESRVGRTFVKALMRKENAVFGGEFSGHYYFRDFFFSDSGVFAALAILGLMRSSKKTLGELIKPFQKYCQSGEINFKIKNKEKMLDKVAARFPDGKISYLDGIKIEYRDWWFNLRPSNTEDLLRLNIEASNKKLLEEKKKILSDLIIE